MISPVSSEVSAPADRHTLWGLEPVQLHDRFWAACGVQVVRQGEPSDIVDGAELFLLTAPHVLTIFKLKPLVETLSWIKPVLLYVRLRDDHERVYRERAITDDNQQFIRFERIYDNAGAQSTRVALTAHREVALAWQMADSTAAAWKQLRHTINADQTTASSIIGRIYDSTNDLEAIQFIRGLISQWRYPDATIKGVNKIGPDAWASTDAQVDASAKFVGPVWIGAGRQLENHSPIVGPAALWDDPQSRPAIESLEWEEIEPSQVFVGTVKPAEQTAAERHFKRIFDIAFAALLLLVTLPFYPIIMLAIWLEDGRPLFFSHERETVGGKSFGCIKFRSMRRDAEAIKTQLSNENGADGPQFFIENDPRLTRVGRLLRRTNLDEIPQFINVLLGHMSIVGPRPSPFSENQFCPAWREARLSVRPGVTGLWQIKRSRLEGMDFQEWIRYDIEYVENANFWLDLRIICKTIPIVLHGVLR